MVEYGIECPTELARWQQAFGHRTFEKPAQTVEDPARLLGSQLPSLLIGHLHRATLELEDRSDGLNGRDRNEVGDSRGEFDLDRVLGGLGRLDAQECARLRLSSEFTFPLVEGGRRTADRLTELRSWSIGSLALGDNFGTNLGGFRGREARQR